jgi:hypothetical protein
MASLYEGYQLFEKGDGLVCMSLNPTNLPKSRQTQNLDSDGVSPLKSQIEQLKLAMRQRTLSIYSSACNISY